MNNPLDDILERCVIVLLGNFNPAILQPEWFLKHSIVPSEEIEGLMAEPSVKEIPEIGLRLEYGQAFSVSNEHAFINFKTFTMRAVRNKFEIISKNKDCFSLISNFITKLFSMLEETPLSAYGVNFDEHYKFAESYDETFARFFTKNESLLRFFGQELTCGCTLITRQVGGVFTLTLQPSERLKNGVFLKANFHYDISDGGSSALVSDFRENFRLTTDFFKMTIIENFAPVTEYLARNGEFKQCNP
jgi:hypothetical protein